ncbi:hypothetical protein PV350_26150 [Streptomyces sp. PA03-6a]|nr:hypothetical protein [Streptomyces sp. PA03-6a]
MTVRLAHDVEVNSPGNDSCRTGGSDLGRIPPHDPPPLTKFC